MTTSGFSCTDWYMITYYSISLQRCCYSSGYWKDPLQKDMQEVVTSHNSYNWKIRRRLRQMTIFKIIASLGSYSVLYEVHFSLRQSTTICVIAASTLAFSATSILTISSRVYKYVTMQWISIRLQSSCMQKHQLIYENVLQTKGNLFSSYLSIIR